MLRSLGVAGDTDAGATLVEDLEQLTARSSTTSTSRASAPSETPPWTRAQALELARDVVGDPRAASSRLAVLTEAPDSRPRCGSRFATDVLDEVERRKRRLGVLSYDDLLSQLADALADDRRPGPAADARGAGSSC